MISRFARRLAMLFRRRLFDTDLEEEMQHHLAMKAQARAEEGVPAAEARCAAQREFGNSLLLRERSRDMWGFTWLETLLQDLRYGSRQLRRNPGFTVVAILTLALGIGANTAIFSVVNAVVLRPLPYPQSNRLVWITEYVPVLKAYIAGGADYVDWKEQNKTLEQMTAYDDSASFNMSGRGTPARVQGAQVSASFFPTLDVQPELGRSFTAEEDKPNGPHVAILMHSFWQQYFGSDPGVLGRTVTLDGTPYAVVGVMPASFKFPGNSEAQFLVPLQLDEPYQRLRQMIRMVHIIGRLKPEATVARAQNDLEMIRKRAESSAMAQMGPSGPAGPGPGQPPLAPSGPGQNMMMRFQTSNAPPPGPGMGVGGPNNQAPPSGNGVFVHPSPRTGQPPSVKPGFETGKGGPASPVGRAGNAQPGTSPMPAGNSRVMPPPSRRLPEVETEVVPLEEHLAGNLRPAMLTMLGVVGLVLLIACANVANLMLARAATRGQEVAVRAALGAGRWRLVRQMLTESAILALAGGLVGLILSVWGVEVMARLIPSSLGGGILGVAPPHVDASVLLFALGVSAMTGVLFGLAPAVTATRPGLVERLKESTQVSRAGAGGGWLRTPLAVVELSLALIVLIGAGLLMKSFYRILSVNLGFAPEHILTMGFNLTDSRYPKPEQKLAFFSEVLRRAASLPGVRSAALSDSLPLSPIRARLMITPPWLVPPAGSPPGSNMVQMSRLAVSPSYFYTLGIPVLEGRTFTEGDNEQAAPVAVVNEALGRRLWPGEDPVGKEMPLLMGSPGQQMTIVGVVGNTHHNGPGAGVESEIYVPYLQSPGGEMQLAVRSAVDAANLSGAIRRAVAAIDPEQPIAHVATLEQTLSESVAPQRFNTFMLGVLALIALALSTVGIYGVIAYSVTQRTREIGIRMAMGAERNDVLRLVVGQGLKLTLIGVGLGIVGALALTRLLAGFLFGVKPTDLLTFVVVSLVLTGVALLASYIPARRATKVDPMVALRYE